MALPTSGIITMDMIRQELGRTGMISLNDPDARALAGKLTGHISLSDFYGKSAAMDEILVDIGYVPASGDSKLGNPQMRGYWTRNPLFIAAPNTNAATIQAATAQSVSISPEEYQMLYDDGLVDVEPQAFFALREESLQSSTFDAFATGASITPMAAATANAGGTIAPTTIRDGYTITTLMESIYDSAATSAVFIVEVSGHVIPQNAISKVEVRSTAGALLNTLHVSDAVYAGERMTYTLTEPVPVTVWTWAITPGYMFPTSGQRIIRIYG